MHSMRSPHMSRFIPCVLLLAALSIPASAAIIEFNDRATFEATVPGLTTFDFETGSGFPAAPSTVDVINATIDLSTSGGDSFVSLSDYGNGFGQAIGGSSGGAVDNFSAVVVVFSAPYYAVGFDNLDLTANEFAIVNLVTASGTTAYSRIDADGDFSTAAFFGFWSDEAIVGLRVWSGNNPADLPGSRANLIDNLSISRIQPNVPEVPEPSTFWLLTGAGLVFAGWRKKRS